MSLYIKVVGNEVFYGGMKSITMDYAVINPMAPLSIILGNMRLVNARCVFVVGSAVTANFVKGKLSANGLWSEEEIRRMSRDHDVKIIVWIENEVRHYNAGNFELHPITDEYYVHLHGCSLGQMEAVLDYDIIPTRWEIGHTTVLY